ncbi:MAG TPA: methyl-accepting chemotaxis protein, partial [Methylophaga sp.]|nr:methyl-accepting chemotaxis protein [Methylophaga sp.]
MTLKKRFSILLCLVILAMVITNIVSQVNIKTLLQLEEQHQTLEKIKSAMLMLRRNEKDFILRQDPKYLAEFDKNNQVLGKLLDDFTIRLEQVDMSSESVRSLKEALSTYESNFHSYALTSQQIGLSPELGLYGNLRKSVHEVETLVSDQDDRLLADMLMLRRNEKDFMLRKDIKYLDKFNTNLTKFETDLSSSYISADLKQSISQTLSVYQKEFLLFVAGQQKLGLSPDQNIQGAMRASVHK